MEKLEVWKMHLNKNDSMNERIFNEMKETIEKQQQEIERLKNPRSKDCQSRKVFRS